MVLIGCFDFAIMFCLLHLTEKETQEAQGYSREKLYVMIKMIDNSMNSSLI